MNILQLAPAIGKGGGRTSPKSFCKPIAGARCYDESRFYLEN
jgi:hypothetical protein